MLMEFIRDNAELLSALGVNLLLLLGALIPKLIGDAKTRRMLSQLQQAQLEAQKAQEALTLFTDTVSGSIERLEVDNLAVNNQLVSMNIMAERIESLTKIVEDAKEESRTLREELNRAKNRERV